MYLISPSIWALEVGVTTIFLPLKSSGDLRISLSDDPVKEVKIGNEILKSLNLRNRGVKIISCPSCARQAFNVIDTVKILEQKLSHIKTPISLSIIGCVVNGPGEAALTDIGITGGGKGNNMLYLKGVQTEKISSKNISIFPNPVKNTLNIQGEMESVEIFDVFGKLVLTSTNNTINTSDLADGVYIVHINTNNMIVTKRITVTK